MPFPLIRVSILSGALLLMAGCGGSSSNGSGGGTPPPSAPTMVTYTFTGGTPTAVATRIGTGAFTQATLQSGVLRINIPSGETNYSVAYECPIVVDGANTLVPNTAETILMANIKDGLSFKLSGCYTPPTAVRQDQEPLQVNAAAIATEPGIEFVGAGDTAQLLSGGTMNFNIDMAPGTYDIPVSIQDVTDTNTTVLAIRILRNQAFPGVLNGGNPVVFGASDVPVPQPISYQNVPAGYYAPGTNVSYTTKNGASLQLIRDAASQYPAMPPTEVQSSDSYFFLAGANSTVTPTEGIEVIESLPGSSGGPQTFTFPAPWHYAGPTAAALPTFNFNYSGFSGMADVSQSVEISWNFPNKSPGLTYLFTSANYQNGATIISIPDLSALSGFTEPVPAGTSINWNASIEQGTGTTNTTTFAVYNSGAYTVP